MALQRRDRLALHALNSSLIEATFFGLHRFIKASGWISKNNQYSTDVVRKIIREDRSGGIKQAKHLSQYIAASCLLHCADGWSYLGRSIIAMLRGDPHRCRHLAYYAELRATMSLLATQGVGVFDRKHVLVDGVNSVAVLRGEYGTHQFAWDCLRLWSAQPSSGALFTKVIRPSGLALDAWLAPLGGAISVAPQAEAWFQQWGMDLKLGLDDRNSRNESSYRPDGLPKAWYLDGNDAITFVHNMWSALEPAGESRFESIDRHILRISLERYFRGVNGRTPKGASKKYRKLVEDVVSPLSFSPEMERWWCDFLQGRPSRKSRLFLRCQARTIRTAVTRALYLGRHCCFV